MNTDTRDFLAALTFSAGEDSSILDASPDDFAAPFVDAVENFISAFRVYLDEKGIEPFGDCPRSFGGNVFFSISGHGVGFWDEGDDLADANQAALESFAGKYRFEDLAGNCDWNDAGEIDLAFKFPANDSYRLKYFLTEWMRPRLMALTEND